MLLRGSTLFLAACLAAGCGGPTAGKLMADTKVPTKENPDAVLVPYQPPDIEELSGVPEEEEDADADKAAPAPEPKQ